MNIHESVQSGLRGAGSVRWLGCDGGLRGSQFVSTVAPGRQLSPRRHVPDTVPAPWLWADDMFPQSGRGGAMSESRD